MSHVRTFTTARLQFNAVQRTRIFRAHLFQSVHFPFGHHLQHRTFAMTFHWTDMNASLGHYRDDAASIQIDSTNQIFFQCISSAFVVAQPFLQNRFTFLVRNAPIVRYFSNVDLCECILEWKNEEVNRISSIGWLKRKRFATQAHLSVLIADMMRNFL